MPDTKITALTAIGANPIIPSTFPIPMVDLTDTSMAASGTTKKVTVNQILGAGGTATLASATITGDLTVDTNTLKVDSASDVVGINTTSPLTGTDGGLTVGTIGSSKAIAVSMFNCFARLRERDAINNFAITTNIDTTNAVLDDNTRTSWKVRFGSGNDNFLIQRAAIGSTTFQDLYSVSTSSAVWYDGAGGTRMTLNSTGLGLGVSPITALSFPIGTNKVVGQSATSSHAAGNVGSLKFGIADGGGDYSGIQIFNTHNGTYSSQDIRFFTGEGGVSVCTERMRITPSGNVGIGVTPSAWGGLGTGPGVLQMGNAGCSVLAGGAGFSGTNQFFINNNAYYNATGGSSFKYYRAGGGAAQYSQVGNEHQWKVSSNTPVADTAITFTQAMTLDASGNLLVGTTTAGAKITALAGASGQAAIFQQPAQNFWCVLAHNQATSGDNSFVLFGTEASFTSRGSITYNRAAGQVSYNITSDYRLKEDVKPLTGALNRISSLKPSTYKFKETGFTCEGFIAHELAEVIPAAVTGEKDAVNEDGSIKAQGVDLSKVVPILVAAIQELTARVQTLETR